MTQTPAHPAMPATATPPLMRKLREHTAPVHAATEALPLMRRVLTEHPSAAGYRGYLAAFHGVYLAVEPPLYAAAPAPLLRALGIAPKLPALQQDLLTLADAAPETGAALTQPLHQLPPQPPLQPDTCSAVHRLLEGPHPIATALGGLYVLEGATLGGQVIARQLRAHWPDGRALPTRFLEFRLAHPGVGWRGFGAALERWAAQHPGSERAILAGALGVFRLMHAALAATEPVTPTDAPTAQPAARSAGPSPPPLARIGPTDVH